MESLLNTIIENRILLLTVSFLSWSSLYIFVSAIIYNIRLTKELQKINKVHISEAFVSAIQGFVCGGIGLIVILKCRHDVMNEKNKLIPDYAFIGTGYFMYDLIAMYYSNWLDLKLKGKDSTTQQNFKIYLQNNGLMIAHHIILTAVLFPALITFSPMGHFFAGCFFSMELSSPFVNFRIILSRLKLKETKLYLYNGITMMITFAIFRVLIFIYMYANFAIQRSSALGLSLIGALQTIPLICHFCCSVVLAPQLYWLSMMISGVYAVLAKRPKALDKYD